MGVRRAAAVLTLGAALTGCGNGTGPDIPPAAAAEQVVATPPPAAFTDVPYDHYEEAALQTGIAPSAVVKEEGFAAGLADLCDNTPAEYSAMADRMRAEASASEDPTNALDQRLDEVDLRVGLACRSRMADWMSARRAAQPESAQLDSSNSGTGQFEEAGSNYPSVDPAADATTAEDSGELTYEDYEAGYTEEGGAPDPTDTPSAGPTASSSSAPTGTSSVRLEPEESASEAATDGSSVSDSAYHETAAW
jgi:hypothetical protein